MEASRYYRFAGLSYNCLHTAYVIKHILIIHGVRSSLILCPPLATCRICNQDIVSRVKQVICFAFHDSRLLLETCREASEQRRVVALFYLD